MKSAIRNIPFIIVYLLINSSMQAQAPLLYLKKYAGRYPSEIKGQGYHSFFQLPQIRSELRRLLPKEQYKLLTSVYEVEVPIELVGSYLIINRCMPHCCPCQNALLAIDLQNGAMLALFWDRSDESTTCFSTGVTVSALPEDIKEKYLEGHIPRTTANDKLTPKNQWLDKVKCR